MALDIVVQTVQLEAEHKGGISRLKGHSIWVTTVR